MSKKGAKYLIIIASLLAMGTGAYFIFRKKDDTNTDDAAPAGSTLPGSHTTDTSLIGKKAFARGNDVYVRSSSDVKESVFGAYNNRVGKLSKDQQAGEITGVVSSGSDGKSWLSVKSNADYDCPFFDCGFTIGTNTGYVRSEDVYVK